MEKHHIRAADAAHAKHVNDTEEFDEIVDILSEKILILTGTFIKDPYLRRMALADAFAKSHVDETDQDDIIDSMDDAAELVRECVARYIIDNDPELSGEFRFCVGDGDNDLPGYPDHIDDADRLIYYDDEGDPQDVEYFCDTNLCGGDCGICPYNNDVPIFVYEDGMVRKIPGGRNPYA